MRNDIPDSKVNLIPGSRRGLGPQRNYNAKPPKLGGGQGIKAPAIIAKALGVNIGMPVHQQLVGRLLDHPDTNVAAAAKRLMAKY